MRARRFFPIFALSVAIAMTGCSASTSPVSGKVQSYYDSNKSLAPVTKPAALPVVAFLGDSYTQGTGASTANTRWSTLLAASEGWKELNFGIGGTNYGTKGAMQGGTTYVQRVPEVIAGQPDIVIVSGGRNNLGESQSAGITETFTQLRAGLPNAKIIAVSPLWDDDAPPAGLAIVSDQVRNAAMAVNATYLDIGQPFSGKPELISEDGVHPNNAGYAALADIMQSAIQKAGPY